MGWISEDELRQRVADRLKLADVGDLEPHWDTVIGDAADQARSEITDVLAQRGYSAAQVEAWPRVHSYHRRLSLFYAFTEGKLLQSQQEGEYVSRLDCREELAKVVIQGPDGLTAAPANAPVSSGKLAAPAGEGKFQDEFGNPVRW